MSFAVPGPCRLAVASLLAALALAACTQGGGNASGFYFADGALPPADGQGGDAAAGTDDATGGDADPASDAAKPGPDAADLGSGDPCQACDDGNPCTADECIAATGACSHWPKVGCSGPVQPCDGDHPCPTGVCDSGAHACVPCLTSQDCTKGQVCRLSVCVAGPPCVSSADCKATSQVCDKAAGTCVSCLGPADCPSGQTCHDTQCVQAKPCASDKDCPAVCNPATGTCVGCNDDTDCAVGSFCSSQQTCEPDLCKGTVCLGNVAYACSENGSAYLAGQSCDDGDPCTSDTCVTGKGCTHAPISGPCDDGIACTSGDFCATGGGCQGGPPKDSLCDDSDPCTIDVCGPAGCTASPKCAGATVCKAGTCMAKVCTPGQTKCDGPLLATCDTQGTGWASSACSSGTCSTVTGVAACPSSGDLCCAAKGALCGFVPGCPSNCGNCQAGKVCDTKAGSPTKNKCIPKSGPVKLAYGAACGPTKDCPSPPSGATASQLAEHQQCLDALCETGNCYLGVCTKSGCTIQTDDINNGTGAKGADGIEDPDSPSDCDGATDGPAGKNFKCIEQANPAQGQSFTVCVPMGSAKACQATSDCPGGETCQYRYILGSLQSMCGPAWKNPDGTPGAKVGELCNDDPALGPVATCNNNFCGSTSCLAFCKTDADCGFAYTCKPNVVLNKNPPYSAAVCLPKGCAVDKDCGSPSYFCRAYWNGVKNPKGEPDPVNPANVLYPALDPGCQHKPANAAALGETCDPYPTSPTPGKVCQNPAACADGSCGGLCKGDSDCAPTQKCGVSEEAVDVTGASGSGNADGTYDFTLKIPMCEFLPGASASCLGPSDCKALASTPYCKTYTKAAPPLQIGGSPSVVLAGQCVDPMQVGLAKTGAPCGPAAGDAICASGFCLGSTDTQAGYCVDSCTSKSDCPASVTIDGTAYKTVCRSLFLAWNGTIHDPTDDILVPVCQPVGANHSLTDCSQGQACPGGESCLPFPVMPNPDSAPKADWLCLAPPASAYKKVGASCNPASGQEECELDCLDDVGGKGYCTGLCKSNADCPSGLVCDTAHQWLPRKDAAKTVIVPICKKVAACVPCVADSHCGPGLVCNNLSTTLVPKGRCQALCYAAADCGPGTACLPAKDPQGGTKATKVCMDYCP